MKWAWSVVAALATASGAAAQDVPRPARVRDVQGDVWIQRATESGSEEAEPNLPWLPGDRLWSGSSGQAELQLADGTQLLVATGSTLELLDHDAFGGRDRVAVRLPEGALSLVVPGGPESPEIAVETEDGLVRVREPGVYRVDAIPGETRLTVVDGAAVLESGGERLALDAGERSYAQRGVPPEDPHYFDPADGDSFDAWCAERRREVRAARPVDLPLEIEPYATELSDYGSWSVVAGVGTVWRPRVAVSWQPYRDGRWVWSPWGWTWVGAERWGWAPYHYGSWGFSVSLGWYWVPGRIWSGARVAWSVGPAGVGWCPLSVHGVALILHRSFGRPAWGTPWIYARHSGLGARRVQTHLIARGWGDHGWSPLGRGFQPDRRGRYAVPRADGAVRVAPRRPGPWERDGAPRGTSRVTTRDRFARPDRSATARPAAGARDTGDRSRSRPRAGDPGRDRSNSGARDRTGDRRAPGTREQAGDRSPSRARDRSDNSVSSPRRSTDRPSASARERAGDRGSPGTRERADDRSPSGGRDRQRLATPRDAGDRSRGSERGRLTRPSGSEESRRPPARESASATGRAGSRSARDPGRAGSAPRDRGRDRAERAAPRSSRSGGERRTAQPRGRRQRDD